MEGKDSFLVHSMSLCTRGYRRAPQEKSNALDRSPNQHLQGKGQGGGFPQGSPSDPNSLRQALSLPQTRSPEGRAVLYLRLGAPQVGTRAFGSNFFLPNLKANIPLSD